MEELLIKKQREIERMKQIHSGNEFATKMILDYENYITQQVDRINTFHSYLKKLYEH